MTLESFPFTTCRTAQKKQSFHWESLKLSSSSQSPAKGRSLSLAAQGWSFPLPPPAPQRAVLPQLGAQSPGCWQGREHLMHAALRTQPFLLPLALRCQGSFLLG